MEIIEMATRIQEIDCFEAVDKSGGRYTITESVSQTSLDAMHGMTQWINQSTYFRALGFGPVGQISDSEFEIFLAGVKVVRV